MRSYYKLKHAQPKYGLNTNGKLLLLRHGETTYNLEKDEKARRLNPLLVDCRLSQKGIEQARKKQRDINKLKIEKVYTSPYYRTLETATYCLENHPNLANIVVTVHPLVSEICSSVNNYILDIKRTKKDFNLRSKVKVDWSLFDEYVKKIKWDENFFYFDNMNCLEEEEKMMFYKKLKGIYEKGEIELLRKELGNLAKLRYEKNKKLESLKHVFDRFIFFKDDVSKIHTKTINDIESKILVVTHGTFMSVATSKQTYNSDEIQNLYPDTYKAKNCEIISVYI